VLLCGCMSNVKSSGIITYTCKYQNTWSRYLEWNGIDKEDHEHQWRNFFFLKEILLQKWLQKQVLDRKISVTRYCNPETRSRVNPRASIMSLIVIAFSSEEALNPISPPPRKCEGSSYLFNTRSTPLPRLTTLQLAWC
jgi:hypothetical protein